jgi:quinol monooxygenase YgiN
MSVTRVGEFRAAEGKGDAMAAFLASVAATIRASEGALSCAVLRDRADPVRFVVIEQWETAEAHQASVKNIPPAMLREAQTLFGAAPTGSYFDAIA